MTTIDTLIKGALYELPNGHRVVAEQYLSGKLWFLRCTPEAQPGDTVQRSTSLSAWVACPTCQVLITTGERQVLLDRALEAYPVRQRVLLTATIAASIRSAHAGFWRHRQPAS